MMPTDLAVHARKAVISAVPKVGWISKTESLVDDQLDQLPHVVRTPPSLRHDARAAPPRTGRRDRSRRTAGGSSQTLLRHVGQEAPDLAKHVSSSSAPLSIVPARSTAICGPPSSSLVIFWPNARSTTGGPAAKIWLVPLTMIDQCERMARPAGPPAACPSPRRRPAPAQQLDRALEAVHAGKHRVCRGADRRDAAASAVDQVDQRNAVARRQVLDEAALAALLALARPARCRRGCEVLAADRDRTPSILASPMT